jgi:hypothetical protein
MKVSRGIPSCFVCCKCKLDDKSRQIPMVPVVFISVCRPDTGTVTAISLSENCQHTLHLGNHSRRFPFLRSKVMNEHSECSIFRILTYINHEQPDDVPMFGPHGGTSLDERIGNALLARRACGSRKCRPR